MDICSQNLDNPTYEILCDILELYVIRRFTIRESTIILLALLSECGLSEVTRDDLLDDNFGEFFYIFIGNIFGESFFMFG